MLYQTYESREKFDLSNAVVVYGNAMRRQRLAGYLDLFDELSEIRCCGQTEFY